MLEQPQMCEKAKGMRHDRIKGVCYVVTRVSSCKLPLSQPPGDLIVRIRFLSKWYSSFWLGGLMVAWLLLLHLLPQVHLNTSTSHTPHYSHLTQGCCALEHQDSSHSITGSGMERRLAGMSSAKSSHNYVLCYLYEWPSMQYSFWNQRKA